VKLLDTSIAVDHLRGYRPATALFEGLIQADVHAAASELTRFELLSGVRPAQLSAPEELFGVIEWVPVVEEMTRQASEFARFYRRSHSGIGVVDYLIAGTAAVLDAELLTLNVRHFPMFDGLRAPYRYD
jgi:predicted nucleic acid-binding protein